MDVCASMRLALRRKLNAHAAGSNIEIYDMAVRMSRIHGTMNDITAKLSSMQLVAHGL